MIKRNNICSHKSKVKGRGVYASQKIRKGCIIEISPVIILPPKDRKYINKTKLYDYYFWWGKDKKKTAIALGMGSLYNHSYLPNARYVKNFRNKTIIFSALKTINKGEEITINYNGHPDDIAPVWFKVRSVQ